MPDHAHTRGLALPGATDPVSRYHLRALDRAVDILEVLVEAGMEMGPSEIGAATALHRATTHRLLAVLERRQLVVRNPSHGRYGVGPRLLDLAQGAAASVDMRQRALPVLESLVQQTGETAHVALLDSAGMLSVASVASPWTPRPRAAVGRRTPVHCTAVGKAVLAFLPSTEVDAILDRHGLTRATRQTITTWPDLQRALETVRLQGYAVDAAELEPDMCCVAAPIRDAAGHVRSALSVSGPACRFPSDRIHALASTVMAAAGALSRDD
jgi:IclR family acetate operon transcriptional repressor